jgi:hypothetical protein
MYCMLIKQTYVGMPYALNKGTFTSVSHVGICVLYCTVCNVCPLCQYYLGPGSCCVCDSLKGGKKGSICRLQFVPLVFVGHKTD